MPILDIDLEPEKIICVTTPDDGTATITRKGDNRGAVRTATVQFPAIEVAPTTCVKIGPFSKSRRYRIQYEQPIEYEITDKAINTNLQATGIYSGGLLGINGSDNTKFDIASGQGTIIDNYSDPENPIIVEITWPTIEAITPTYLSSAIVSFVGIDRGGNVAQFVGTINEAERRDYIIIGILVHTQGVIVEGVAFFPYPAYDSAHALIDLADVMGPINKTGNKFSANGSSLELQKNSGELHRIGINWQNSQKVPNTITVPAEATPNFFLSYQDGLGSFKGFERDTEIDPTKYDDGTGTLATISGNKWQIMRIYLAANFDVIVSPGQVLYNNQTNALNALNTETFSKNPVLDDTNLRAFLVIRKNCTDLSDTNKAVFINADKYGQVAAEGASFNIPAGIATVTSTAKTSDFTVNLNNAYRIDNSSGAIQGTLAQADEDHVGCIAECWIMSSPATYNVTIRGANDTDTINGVTGTASNPAVATFSSATTGYKMVRITVIDENEYLIDSPDSVST